MLLLKINFKFTNNGSFNSDELNLMFTAHNKGITCVLSSVEQGPLNKSTSFIIACQGFSTESEINAFCIRLKNALIIYSVKNSMGVYIRSEIIDINSSVAKVRTEATGGGIAYRNPDAFLSKIASGLETCINKKLQLALDLFHSSYFESTDRAKFLTYIMVIEALSGKEKKGAEIQEYLDALKSIVNSNLDENLISQTIAQDVKSGLGQLKNRSFRDMGAELVRKHVDSIAPYDDMLPDNFFLECYKIRSNIVHPTTDTENLSDKTKQLKCLTEKLLISLID